MRISDILSHKPAKQVVTIKPEATISEAAKLLSDKGIGAVVVSTTGEDVVGILSERDIVRELGRRGPACMADTVADLMTREVATTTPEETAQSVLQTMTDGRFRHVPVMEDGRMVGLVSIGDIVSARLREMALENQAMQEMIMGR